MNVSNLKESITSDYLRTLFDFDELTGCLIWVKNRRGHACKGTVAGSVDKDGYVDVGIDGRLHKAHRVIWCMKYGEWPSGRVDHINGVKSDNRIENLRIADNSQNGCNRGAQSNSASKVKGVSWNARQKCWVAKINYRRKQKFLGYFRSVDEAASAYAKAASIHHGEFAKTA